MLEINLLPRLGRACMYRRQAVTELSTLPHGVWGTQGDLAWSARLRGCMGCHGGAVAVGHVQHLVRGVLERVDAAAVLVVPGRAGGQEGRWAGGAGIGGRV